MSSILYYIQISPPSRSVLLTASALGLDLELKELSLSASEHLEPGFLKASGFWNKI